MIGLELVEALGVALAVGLAAALPLVRVATRRRRPRRLAVLTAPDAPSVVCLLPSGAIARRRRGRS